MQKKKIEFPNPVLSNDRDDYLGCSFELKVDYDNIRIDDINITVPVVFDLQCDGLKELVDSKSAITTVLVESSFASYRTIYKFSPGLNNGEILIPKNYVVKDIELTGYIVAAQDLVDFSLPEMNQDYFKGVLFNLRKGDILALEPGTKLFLNDSDLEKPLASIFNVNENPEMEEEYRPDFNDHKIIINLKPSAHKAYVTMREFNNGMFERMITCATILPALTEALDRIIRNRQHEEDETEADLRWFRAIEKKCNEKNINLYDYSESTAALASMLIGDVIPDALVGFNKAVDEMQDKGGSVQLSGGD